MHTAPCGALDFTDDFFKRGLREWLTSGGVTHDTSHVRDANTFRLPEAEAQLGHALAEQLQREKAIMGVFDEGCMGMFNAIIPDHLLNPTGVFKETPLAICSLGRNANRYRCRSKCYSHLSRAQGPHLCHRHKRHR